MRKISKNHDFSIPYNAKYNCLYLENLHGNLYYYYHFREQLLQKINESTPVSCRRKFDFNDLWDPVKYYMQYSRPCTMYTQSYRGYKTTMITEWMVMLDFICMDLLSRSDRGGSEKFKMKIHVSSGFRTQAPPPHDRWISSSDCSATTPWWCSVV